MAEGTLKTLVQALERVKAQIRARVEPRYYVVKNLFGYKKAPATMRRTTSMSCISALWQ